MAGQRLFDLNIEEVLENWETHHAIREIIANALDEQLITRSKPIEIFRAKTGPWIIRDYGRGIRIEHFTLNENEEKLSYPSGIIGKFGVGLKDALATFNRRGVGVRIFSPVGIYKLHRAKKHSFENIITLHVSFHERPINIVGTAVELTGVSIEDISQAKSLFLKFSNSQVLEETPYGQIFERGRDTAHIYINGVLASEEPNFLFSYNITNLTEAMKKRLNRERINVGRMTYTDRVKSILKSATSRKVLDLLANEATRRATGEQSDELQWIEISKLAYNLLHERRSVAYVTEDELQSRPEIMDNLHRDGYQVVVVNEREKVKLSDQIDSGGLRVRTIETYTQEYNDSFEYSFVDPERLSFAERRIVKLTVPILSLIEGANKSGLKVLISETMRITSDSTGGVWDSQLGAIVIKRSQLSSLKIYAGILLHEAAHALTGTVDATREFEEVLTQYLGQVAVTALKKKQ